MPRPPLPGAETPCHYLLLFGWAEGWGLAGGSPSGGLTKARPVPVSTSAHGCLEGQGTRREGKGHRLQIPVQLSTDISAPTTSTPRKGLTRRGNAN